MKISKGVRGDKGLETGVYYFEVLIKEPLYGTAVMIGYGTEDTKLHYDNFDYINLVGSDTNSWGICHKGTLWHNGVSKKFCEPFFDKDNIVGVYLNLHDQSMHFFLNGVYLGLGFT
jgi:SPRY domain-containing SOCS box protein 3